MNYGLQALALIGGFSVVLFLGLCALERLCSTSKLPIDEDDRSTDH